MNIYKAQDNITKYTAYELIMEQGAVEYLQKWSQVPWLNNFDPSNSC